MAPTPTTTLECLDAVVSWMGERAAVDVAQRGEPDSPGGVTVVGCSVLDAPHRRDLGRHERSQRILAVWMRLVQQNEQDTEGDLAAFKDDVWTQWLHDRTDPDSALRGSVLDDTLAGLPDYQRLLSGETRMYPFVLQFTLVTALPVTP